MMSDNTQIPWADATWNPILGCTKCASGCRNCYAVGHVHRMAHNPNPKIRDANAGLVRDGNWTGEVRILNSRMDIPRQWKRPRVIFVCSMSDIFHPRLPDWGLDFVFHSMLRAIEWCGHTFIVLTKRPERMQRYVSEGVHDNLYVTPNIYLGFSASTQRDLNTGGPFLMKLAASGWRVWLSLEPLVEEIDLEVPFGQGVGDLLIENLSGVVVGGESGSGPDIRPMHPDWVRHIRDQCAAAGVPFCFKQWGEWAPGEMAPGPITRTERCAWWFNDEWDFGSVTPATIDAHWTDPPDVFRVGKNRAGRLLDGELHDELPWR
jgi:protein gp37